MKAHWRTISLALWLVCSGVGVSWVWLMPDASLRHEVFRESKHRRHVVAEHVAWTADLERKVLEFNPFSVAASESIGGETAAGLLVRPVGPVVMPTRMRVAAIAGPPWRVIITADGPVAVVLTLQVGDTVRGAQIVRIRADTVVVRNGGATQRRVVGESWAQ